MPLREAEAFILRTYPLKESDKIVSFFTREFGKCRGVARGARRPKSKFGVMLEPMSQVRVQFFEREGRDLASLDHCELLGTLMSPVAGGGFDLLHSISVSLMVEIADRMLPEREVNDAVYRLMAAVSGALRVGDDAGGEEAAWLPLTYYLEWMVRLGGFLPELATAGLSSGSLELGAAVLRQPVGALRERGLRFGGKAGRELRQILKSWIENHIEANLKSWPMLASLETSGVPPIT